MLILYDNIEFCEKWDDCVGFSVYKHTVGPTAWFYWIDVWKKEFLWELKNKQTKWLVTPHQIGQCKMHTRIESQQCTHDGYLSHVLYIKGNFKYLLFLSNF